MSENNLFAGLQIPRKNRVEEALNNSKIYRDETGF